MDFGARVQPLSPEQAHFRSTDLIFKNFHAIACSGARPGKRTMTSENKQKEVIMNDLDAVTGAANCNHGPMLDALMLTLKVTTDAALSRKLMVPPPVISKLRNNKIGVSAGLLVRIHDVTGMSINKVRTMLGLPIPQPREGRTLKNVVYSPIAPAPTRKRRAAPSE